VSHNPGAVHIGTGACVWSMPSSANPYQDAFTLYFPIVPLILPLPFGFTLAVRLTWMLSSAEVPHLIPPPNRKVAADDMAPLKNEI
jgi:hypothetical protein